MFNLKYLLKRIGIGVILIVSLVFLLKSCDTKKVKSITDTDLKKDEQVAIILEPRKGTVTTIRRNRKDKKETTITQKPVEGARDIRIGVSPEGRVVITARTHGFIYEPGFVGGWGKGIRLGADVQLYFWQNWGVNAGVTTTANYNIKPFVAGSYNLNKLELSNTSVLVGMDSRKELLIAMRLKF